MKFLFQGWETDRIPASTYPTRLGYELRMAKRLGFYCLEYMYRDLGIDIWRNRVLPVFIGQGANNLCAVDPHPFAECHSIDQVEAFHFPGPNDFDTVAMMRELTSHYEFSIVAGGIAEGWVPGIFYLYLQMCGQENGFVFLKEQPAVAKAMIRRITDYWVQYTQKVLDAGHELIDIFAESSDFGTQQGLMISLEDFREFFKPALRRIYNAVKDYGVKVMQHSCGAIEPLIPEFIELGADILNPIQTTAAGMDIRTLHRKYHKDIIFFGGIDTQQLLSKGSEEEVREEVRRLKNLFSDNYILAPSHEFGEDVPLSNAMAVYDENLK